MVNERRSSPEDREQWVDVELPNRVTCRILYSQHASALEPGQQRDPRALGGAELIGLEGVNSVNERPLLTKEMALTFWREAARQIEQETQHPNFDTNSAYARILAQAKAEETPLFFVDAFVPARLIGQTTTRESMLELASLGGFASLMVANAVLSRTPIEAPEKTRTRRNVLGILAGVAAFPVGVPIIDRMSRMADIRDVDEGISDASLIEKAVHFVREASTATKSALGIPDVIVGFRNVVMAEKLLRMGQIASERGERRIAHVVGAGHTGLELALRMNPAERSQTIEQFLATFAKMGFNAGDIRRSVEVTAEVTWNKSANDWTAEMHEFPLAR